MYFYLSSQKSSSAKTLFIYLSAFTVFVCFCLVLLLWCSGYYTNLSITRSVVRILTRTEVFFFFLDPSLKKKYRYLGFENKRSEDRWWHPYFRCCSGLRNVKVLSLHTLTALSTTGHSLDFRLQHSVLQDID